MKVRKGKIVVLLRDTLVVKKEVLIKRLLPAGKSFVLEVVEESIDHLAKTGT